MNRKHRRQLRNAAYAASSKTLPSVAASDNSQTYPTLADGQSDRNPQIPKDDPTPNEWDGLTDHEMLSRRRIEDDTRICSERFLQADSVPILLENWKWDMEGLSGWTAVLLTAHVSNMDEAGLVELLALAGIDTGDKRTIKREAVHTFVNFGFQAAD